MSQDLVDLSEDDLRTKIIYPWLRGNGISDKDIRVEHSINIQLGKGIRNINSRADVLVKNSQGQNLFIIEVKRPKHKLKDEDKTQAISYARSLSDSDGGIAPFSVLTNGIESKIFDSISGERIDGDIVLSNHPYLKEGFKISADAIKEKAAEALEYLISVCSENLYIFCKAQVEDKMQLLKSDDIYSGRKYIPELYVQREKNNQELDNRISDKLDNPNVVLVNGSPQQGKTCFVCNRVEYYLSKGYFVMFYPAISLKKGLLYEILEDFQWEFKQEFTAQSIINKITKIVKQTGKKAILFIDGWNEMSQNAIELNNECKRIDSKEIKIVLSTTSSSLDRLLIDQADNITHIELRLI
ncbi:type I restriction enzyme HsdR N-terminal domain-containing protein [Myroides sp. mNGS23_01]|nr:type I restriction enzyme HsdR N-terminal domain-containing protein [Myroides sp. mNGS23_01]WHT39461.1 type I restriction enzyme HsdR N-terminal domain-containing protein [Myroides sp. mNGS23_01]